MAARPSRAATPSKATIAKASRHRVIKSAGANDVSDVDFTYLYLVDKSAYRTDDGDRYAVKGDWTAAKAAYAEAQSMWLNNERAIYGLGRCAAHDGDLATAIAYYRKNIYSTDPNVFGTVRGDGYAENDPRPLMEFALYLSEAGQADEAVRVYNRTLQFYTPIGGFSRGRWVPLPAIGQEAGQTAYTPSYFQAMVHLALSLCVEYINDHKSKAEVQAAWALAPNSSIVHVFLGMAQFPVMPAMLPELLRAMELDGADGPIGSIAHQLMVSYCGASATQQAIGSDPALAQSAAARSSATPPDGDSPAPP